MPAEQNPVVVTKSADLKVSGGQTEGMIRQNALASLTDGICASRMIVFAFAGRGVVVSESGKKRQPLAPGDYALIPAYAEHQEVNDGGTRTWCGVLCEAGGNPRW